MKKFILATLVVAMTAVSYAAAPKKVEKIQSFSLLYRNSPSMGIKIVGHDPALVHARKEFSAMKQK